jgi:hypothetical protein
VAARFLSCAGQKNVIGVCVEHREPAQGEGTNDLLREGSSDNRYRDVLATLLELVLFELIPTLSLKPKATLSVFVATRVRQSSEFTQPLAVLKFQEKYGYGGDARHVRTIDEAAVFPILAEVLSRRSRSQRTVSVEHARGVTLAYPTFKTEPWHERERAPSRGSEPQPGICILIDAAKGGPLIDKPRPKWDKTRHQHYVADLVAGACYRYGRGERDAANVLNTPPWSHLFRRGTYDLLDRPLRALMQAARLLSREELEGALLELVTLDWRALPEAHSSVPLIAGKLAQAVRETMCGAEFARLAALIGGANLTQHGPGSEVKRKGVIKSLDLWGGFGYIRDRSRTDYRFDVRAWASATEPVIGEPVEFLPSKPPNGRNRATWVKSLY